MHPTERQINDYADGSLAQGDRASIAEHVDRCADCRALLNDLAELRRVAAALEPLEPPARVWSQLEAATESYIVSTFERTVAGPAQAGHDVRRKTGHRVLGWGIGLAAAAVLALATVAGLRLWQAQDAASTSTNAGTALQSVEAELRAAEQHYQHAIAGLEQIAAAENGALDARTSATLRENLAVVDRAIDESRAALRAQPDSDAARQSLLDGFRTKVILLQDTIALMNDRRVEDTTGRTPAVSGMKRGI
jgi:anti-sigma factor RsiW